MRVRRRRTMAAEPAAVWSVVSDPHHLPRWWPGVTRVEEANALQWTKVLATRKGKPVRADFTRTRAEDERLVAWRQELAESPFERLMSEYAIEIELCPQGDAATEVEIRARQRLRGISRLGGPLARRALRKRIDAALDGLEAVTA